MNHLVGSYWYHRNAFLEMSRLVSVALEHNEFQLLPVVHRKLMVEIMVSFPHRKDGGQKVVARRVPVIVWRASEIVSNGVDAKRALGLGQAPPLLNNTKLT